MKYPKAYLVFFLLVGALATHMALSPRKSPTLTSERLIDAKSKWNRFGPQSYRVLVGISGNHTARHEVTVSEGRVISLFTGGSLAPERTWEVWTVAGMFQTLEEELANRARPQAPYGVSHSEDVHLDAEFDKDLGIPTHFLRQVTGRPQTIEWRVTLMP